MIFKDVLKVWLSKFELKTVTNVDRLKLEISNIKKNLKSVDESYYKSRGKEKSFSDRIIELNSYIEKCYDSAKKVGDSDDILLLRIKNEIETSNKNLELVGKSLALAKNLTQKLYIEKNLIESKLSDASSKLEILIMKNDFTNDIKGLSEVININNDSEFDSISKEIEVDFNASDFKLEDIKESSIPVSEIIKSLSKDNGLDSFKNELKSR